ncbi:MAG: N-acetyltransferase [Actinobacteria bacterium HGW-Actinobacteria-1]|nr:MAG: N-acetyltransferase [Actinobacteria bacterium HGW-Actinobacteria-1]
MTIRTASLEDAPLLADLGARTFADTFAADNTAEDMADYLARSFGVDIQARELSDDAALVFIAEVAGVAAGYARLRFGATLDCIPGARPVEIHRIYADAPWIGKGVGAALMQACLAEATRCECDTIWLDVWERNPRAIAFYARWGFEVVGAQEFVLGDDVQHDLVMARGAAGGSTDAPPPLEHPDR